MKYCRKAALHEATLDGSDTVLLDVATSKYFDLNPVATRIWRMLEQPLTFDDICNTLQAEFDVGEEECREQVQGFLRQMCDKGLCETADG